MLVFWGYYQIGKGLVTGNLKIPFIPSLNSPQEKQEVQTTVIVGESQLPPAVEMPEGVMETWDGTSPVTVLIMGLDYRDWSAGTGPSRTDTMMLLTLDPLNNTAGMLSIPRDLWVSIPGFDNDRINVAYFLGEAYKLPGGGPAMAVKTVEGLLGVGINYYALLDFGAFVRFVDELGGVKIDVPERIKIDPIVGDPIYLKPERQTLNGELALAYARARNTPNGDLDRALRQQQVVFGIRDRLLKPESLSEMIAKAPKLYTEIASGVRTNMTLDEAIKLALLAQKVPDENIIAGAIAPTDVNYAMTPDGRSVLLPRTEKIRQLRDKIFLVSSGTLGPLSPGDPQERMATEGAVISIINGTQDDTLGNLTQDFLISQGATIIEVTEGEFNYRTRIIDHSGNPHTMNFLISLFDLQPGYFELDYDPTSSVDVQIILGTDWGGKFNSP
jgi:LCP family protein required for cell wall assembly